jgi:hypothetical protein
VAFDSSGRVTSAGNIVVTRVPGASDGVIGGNWRHGRSSEGHPDYLWVPFSILNPADPNQNNPTDTYANPQVDLDWVRRHILTGIVDTTSPPSSSVPDAPEPRPTRSPSPGGGTNPQPGPRPTGRPVPL